MTALIVFAALRAPQSFNLQFRPKAGQTITWQTVENNVEGKATHILGTQFQLTLNAGGSASLTTGPFNSGGRTFGRPKVRQIALTPQGTLAGDGFKRPPFLLSMPLPDHPVKAGDRWTAAVVGPTPMPAGVKVIYRLVGPAKAAGAACVRVSGKIDTEMSGAKITGAGEWIVRLDDGLVQTGSLTALMVYHRPDPVTRKITESARVNVSAQITRR